MRVPFRKPGKYSQMKTDPMLTKTKFAELEKKLKHLQEIQPTAAAEVSRLAELGDFSENAEYQLAKGRLRGLNDAIFRLGNQLKHAVIIEAEGQTNTVRLGHKVTVAVAGKQKTYQILGSAETDPRQGIISQNSPLGAALMGRRAGEKFNIKLAGKEAEFVVIKIE